MATSMPWMEVEVSEDQAGKATNRGGNIVVNRTVNGLEDINWQTEMELIAGEMRIHDTRESWMERAARTAGITFWHAREMLKGKLTDPKWSIGLKVAKAGCKVRLEAAQDDSKRLAKIYQTAAGKLHAIDPDFHRSHVSALLALASEIGTDDSA